MCEFTREVSAILEEMDEIRRRIHEEGSGEHEVRELNQAMHRVTGILRVRLDRELEVRQGNKDEDSHD